MINLGKSFRINYWNQNFCNGYRFGFNGQEKDDEITGQVGSVYTAQYWEYDARIGRRWNVDPVYKPHESPYACFANNPIWFVDPLGLDTIPVAKDENGNDLRNNDGTLAGHGKTFSEVKVTPKTTVTPTFWDRIGSIFDWEGDSKWSFGIEILIRMGKVERNPIAAQAAPDASTWKFRFDSEDQLEGFLLLRDAYYKRRESNNNRLTRERNGQGSRSERDNLSPADMEYPDKDDITSVPNEKEVKNDVKPMPIIVFLNPDSGTCIPYEVDDNEINRALQNNDEVKHPSLVKGKVKIH